MEEGLVEQSGSIEDGKTTVVGIDIDISRNMILWTGTATIGFVFIAVGGIGIVIMRRKPIQILSKMS